MGSPSPAQLSDSDAIISTDRQSLVRAIGVFALELALCAAVYAGWIGYSAAVVLHCAVIAATVFVITNAVRRHVDTSPSILLAIATAVLGPLGALGCVMMPWLSQAGRDSPDLLAAWYKRISLSTEVDPVTRLSDTVAVGRSIDLSNPLPASFVTVFQSGSIADQQRVLGLIARRFHPDYLPVLKSALAHEAPAVRVQAAAVAAHVRVSLARFVDETLDRVSAPGVDPSTGLSAVAELRPCLRSGLLDERDRIRIDRLVAGLEARCYADIDRRGFSNSNLDAAALDAYETHLLNSSRFGEFRSLRHRVRRRLYGRYVVRHLSWVRRPVLPMELHP